MIALQCDGLCGYVCHFSRLEDLRDHRRRTHGAVPAAQSTGERRVAMNGERLATVRLEARPVTLREANRFVAQFHRHHRPARGCAFKVGAYVGEQLVGVAIAGRPVARSLDDGFTLEVTRLATNGHPNACSFLYARVRRAAAPLGYRRIVTYTLPEEGGASLRAAGFSVAGEVRGRSWKNRRGRQDGRMQMQDKLRWEAPVMATAARSTGRGSP